MSGTSNYEIERKFLIKRPDEAKLSKYPGAVRYEIEQIYLPRDSEGNSARIRMRRNDGVAEFFHTVKKRVSIITRIEEEHKITEVEYYALKALAGQRPMAVAKTRYVLPYDGLMVEVDIYPFWNKTAVAEIELESEDGRIAFPDCIVVLREITGEDKYLNRNMAAALLSGVPKEEDI